MSFSSFTPEHEMSAAAFESLLKEASAETLPAWLESRRWFADKGRGIAAVEIEDALVDQMQSHWLALAVARITFNNDETARYLLPLALVPSQAKSDAITGSVTSVRGEVIIDATDTSWFRTWLLDQLLGSKSAASERWNFVSLPSAAPRISAARRSSSSIMRAEQSNSSLRFDDILIAKLFRRLQPGQNPDEEILRALASSGFERVPSYVGSVSWQSREGETFAVAVLQDFVPNVGDGWTWMLQRLHDVAAGAVDLRADDFGAERLLGQRTGELHCALARIQEPEFTPEMPSPETVAGNSHRTLGAIEQTIQLLLEQQERLPENIRARMGEVIEELKRTSDWVRGYEDEAHTARIRVHGDYHLGQTLRTSDADWTIIDFEGEPSRPLHERRQRTSALKDVAGMLRSLSYARGAAERANGMASNDPMALRLLDWETGARRAFLRGYREALSDTTMPLVPAGDEAFHRALAAWELDKALYEIAYEARNRPDWLPLPLRALLPRLFTQPAADRGTAPA